jgi:hypothetical protein
LHVFGAVEDDLAPLDSLGNLAFALRIFLRQPQRLEMVRLRKLIGQLTGLFQRLYLRHVGRGLTGGDVAGVA